MIKAITATIIFLALDALWLGVIAKTMYIDAFGHLLRISNGSIQPYWPAAIVVYIALIGGILSLVIPRCKNQPARALCWGAVFGFVTYATYDFTNLAVLSGWSLKISVIDTIWGMLICGITSWLTVKLNKNKA